MFVKLVSKHLNGPLVGRKALLYTCYIASRLKYRAAPNLLKRENIAMASSEILFLAQPSFNLFEYRLISHMMIAQVHTIF